MAVDTYGTAQRKSGIGAVSENLDYAGLTSNTVSNQAIVVAFIFDGTGSDTGAPTGLTATYDPSGAAQSMYQIVTQTCAPSTGIYIAWFGLVNPTNKGNITIRLTSANFTGNCWIIGSSWGGVDQTGTTTTFANATGSDVSAGNPLSLAITSAANQRTMAALGSRFNSMTGNLRGTTRLADDTNGANINAGIDDDAGASPNVTVGLTGNASATNCPIAGFTLI